MEYDDKSSMKVVYLGTRSTIQKMTGKVLDSKPFAKMKIWYCKPQIMSLAGDRNLLQYNPVTSAFFVTWIAESLSLKGLLTMNVLLGSKRIHKHVQSIFIGKRRQAMS